MHGEREETADTGEGEQALETSPESIPNNVDDAGEVELRGVRAIRHSQR